MACFLLVAVALPRVKQNVAAARDYAVAVKEEDAAGERYEEAIETYKRFMETHPAGKYTDLAREKVEKVLPSRIDQREFLKASNEAGLAMGKGDKEAAHTAYRRYLKAFPKGEYAEEVRRVLHQSRALAEDDDGKREAPPQAAAIPPQRGSREERAAPTHAESQGPRTERDVPTPRPTRQIDPKELCEAAENGNLETVQRLVAEGADVNGKDELGVIALHAAALKGHREIVALLLDKGADVNAKFVKNSMTPLHLAAMKGHAQTVALLLAKGADVSAGTDMAVDPLGYAAAYGHTEVAKLLVAHGADVKASDKSKATALHAAAIGGRKELVEFLLDKGANVNARDERGRTPLDGAKVGTNDPETEAVLRKHGGKSGSDLKDQALQTHEKKTEAATEPVAAKPRTAEKSSRIARKSCTHCGQDVALSSKAEEQCPHCHAYWSHETENPDEKRGSSQDGDAPRDPTVVVVIPKRGARAAGRLIHEDDTTLRISMDGNVEMEWEKRDLNQILRCGVPLYVEREGASAARSNAAPPASAQPSATPTGQGMGKAFAGKWQDRGGFVHLELYASGSGFLFLFPNGGGAGTVNAGGVKWKVEGNAVEFAGAVGKGSGVLLEGGNQLRANIGEKERLLDRQ